MSELADPFPVGSVATVVDYDGDTIVGRYEIVRSYWPKSVVELLTPHGMVRQNHDRMRSLTWEGEQAFAAGERRIVPRDILVDHGADAARAWYRGWDYANLAAPVEGVTT